MLYNYKEVISLFGNDYNLKKAILAKQIFKIEKGIYSDGENNFTVIEIILKKYKHAFLVKDTALHLIGFIENEPAKIHIGTARNALRIKDDRIQQHFYSNLDVAILSENECDQYSHFLSYENIKIHITENNNEIRLFNLKALFFDLVRNYKDYQKSTLFALLEKFKTCRYFHGLTEWELGDNLQHEKIVSDIEFFDGDLYEKIMDVFSEVRHREFKIEYDL
ncbi:MAG: hypothetical protein IKB70_00640 [Bacilli bacterium]|nr:hypothetical protein [Bacilli bacterium]